jgi:sulfur relay (sulfurtransferase) DsrF/TusC family protein
MSVRNTAQNLVLNDAAHRVRSAQASLYVAAKRYVATFERCQFHSVPDDSAAAAAQHHEHATSQVREALDHLTAETECHDQLKMTDWEWTGAELREARQAAIVQLRAYVHDDRQRAIAILDAKDLRGLRCLAGTLLAELALSFIRLVVAINVIEDDAMRELIATADDEQLLAEPAIKAAVDARLEQAQADILLEELDPD